MQQDDGVFQFGRHFFGICHEIWRQVATIELHTFDDIGFCFQTLVFFDGNHAFVADFLHRIGNLLADFCFAVSGDGADLRNFGAIADGTRRGFDRLDDFGRSHVDTALEVHRVHTSSN